MRLATRFMEALGRQLHQPTGRLGSLLGHVMAWEHRAIFLGSVISLTVIMGSVMYMVEGADAGFTSIPRSMYWAIVTLTTVGYGDISPQTPLGQTIASIVMVMGWGSLAVPTGILTVELARAGADTVSGQACPDCAAEGHDHDAKHCKFCGSILNP